MNLKQVLTGNNIDIEKHSISNLETTIQGSFQSISS